MEQGQRAVQSGTEPSGPLRVGVPESMLAYRLPPVLRIFHRRFPHVELSFARNTMRFCPSCSKPASWTWPSA
jgi:DNA-binding transcriptional LysR family regulator